MFWKSGKYWNKAEVSIHKCNVNKLFFVFHHRVPPEHLSKSPENKVFGPCFEDTQENEKAATSIIEELVSKEKE